MKDRFSADSKGYATFRPGYPQEMLEFILRNTKGRNQAWDCATGNGQFAAMLAPHFAQIEATDISVSQLAHATPTANIRYSTQPAESTDFPDGTFDLITVAQAIHWFDFEAFYAELRRVAALDAMIAVIGYPLFSITQELDAVILPFYHTTIHDYWDKERRYLDEDYRTIPFPFKEIESPRFSSTYDWNFEQLIGYLNTWSAVKNYIRVNGSNPLEYVEADLKNAWGNAATHKVHFPMILRMGEVKPFGH